MTQREKFEAWFCKAYHPSSLQPMENSCYLNLGAGMAWDAWQAAQAAQPVQNHIEQDSDMVSMQPVQADIAVASPQPSQAGHLSINEIESLMRESGLESINNSDFRDKRKSQMTQPEQDRYDADVDFARRVIAAINAKEQP